MAISFKASDNVKEAELYVKQFMNKWLPPTRYFHGLHHTIAVVEKSKVLASFHGIMQSDLDVLVLSAWFHDIGYCKSSKGHEEKGIEIFSRFSEQKKISRDIKYQVDDLIRATKISRQPIGLLEKIICDADLHHLGSFDYLMWAQMLRKELCVFERQKFTDQEWRQNNIEFFKRHRFHTRVAEELWNDQKRTNLANLIKVET